MADAAKLVIEIDESGTGSGSDPGGGTPGRSGSGSSGGDPGADFSASFLANWKKMLAEMEGNLGSTFHRIRGQNTARDVEGDNERLQARNNRVGDRAGRRAIGLRNRLRGERESREAEAEREADRAEKKRLADAARAQRDIDRAEKKRQSDLNATRRLLARNSKVGDRSDRRMVALRERQRKERERRETAAEREADRAEKKRLADAARAEKKRLADEARAKREADREGARKKRRRSGPDWVTRGLGFARGLVHSYGERAQRVAHGDGVGFIGQSAEMSAHLISNVPVVGSPVAEGIRLMSDTLRAVKSTADAFSNRGRELAGYNGALAGSVAMQDVTRTLTDIREAQMMGDKYAKLIDAQTRFEETLKAGLLPIKDWILERLPGFLDMILDAIIKLGELLAHITPGDLVDKIVASMKEMKEALTGGAVSGGLGVGLLETWLRAPILGGPRAGEPVPAPAPLGIPIIPAAP